MRLLAVPNWSFGRGASLLGSFREALAEAGVTVHYAESDVDHNRTVTAFSGNAEAVVAALHRLCELAFGWIDMTEHHGVHPRVGALDVCPLIPLEPGPDAEFEAKALAERLAADLAAWYELPVFLYEKSERGRHETDLPTLRKGEFEGLAQRQLRPDFGPSRPHPRLGATILGVRDFLIAMNVNLDHEDYATARAIARTLRDVRQEGDVRFLGVRALGFPLASRRQSQVSLNLTLPDLTPVDPIIEWVAQQAAERAVEVVGTELIGVIREQDLPTATHLAIQPPQVVRLNGARRGA
jgi:glutamate formiminotransferase